MYWLSLAVIEGSNPILEFPSQRSLIAQLGGNLPKRDSFSTNTINGLCSGTSAFGRGIDDRVIGYRFSTIWADNLVFHPHSFLNKHLFL